jgi:hypothetical protein
VDLNPFNVSINIGTVLYSKPAVLIRVA